MEYKELLEDINKKNENVDIDKLISILSQPNYFNLKSLDDFKNYETIKIGVCDAIINNNLEILNNYPEIYRHLPYELLDNERVIEEAIKNGTLGSCIFYGPPGTGKTTLASIIASSSGAVFKKLNAINSGVSDAKEIIAEAKTNLELYGKRTYLLLDECHRWNKAQSDSVLEAIENGSIIFIGSTTENPYTSMTRAIVSRCRIFEFKPLEKNE